MYRFKEKLEQVRELARKAREGVRKRHSLLPAPKGGYDMPPSGALRGTYRELITKRVSEAENNAKLRQFWRWNDDVLLASLALVKPVEYVLKRVTPLRDFLEDELTRENEELAKAIATGNTGYGAEFAPIVFSPELIDLIRVRGIIPIFRRYTMLAPEVRLPRIVSDMVAYRVPESLTNVGTEIPVSDFGTGNVILIAKKLAAASIFSEEISEDSIVPALPLIREQLTNSIAGGIEHALINGSTTSPHPDSDEPTNSVATAWDGLRADAMGSGFSDATSACVDLSTMTVDNLLEMIRKQGRFGTRPGDSVWITSPQGVVKLMGVRDAAGNQVLIGADKFGERAVLTQGAIGNLLGRDVLVSELVKTNLNNVGVTPPTPGEKTQLLLVNTKAFLIGDRRQLTVKSESKVLTDQTIMVATERLDFVRTKASPTALDHPVVIGLNIDAA